MNFFTLRGIALSLSALPLLLYPGILIAGVMSLGAGHGSSAGIDWFRWFIYYSLVYPVAWYLAARTAKKMPSNAIPTTAISLLPLALLMALAAACNTLGILFEIMGSMLK